MRPCEAFTGKPLDAPLPVVRAGAPLHLDRLQAATRLSTPRAAGARRSENWTALYGGTERQRQHVALCVPPGADTGTCAQRTPCKAAGAVIRPSASPRPADTPFGRMLAHSARAWLRQALPGTLQRALAAGGYSRLPRYRCGSLRSTLPPARCARSVCLGQSRSYSQTRTLQGTFSGTRGVPPKTQRPERPRGGLSLDCRVFDLSL